MVKIGINGFGRIGRMVFRAAVKNFSKDIQIVGINDLLDPEYLAYMLTYDSVHGKFEGDVKVEGTNLIVNGNKIRLTAVKDPSTLKWDEVGADIVVESTGLFLDKATAEAHLKAGAKKVIISAPGGKDVDATVVFGVNQGVLKASDTVISNASCTTNCLAPLVKPLNDTIGLINGLMTTVHAYTNDQNLIDNYHKAERRGRSAPLNMVLTETGAAKAVSKVLPGLEGKLTGNAIRVPTPNVSMAILNLQLGRDTSVDELNEFMRQKALHSELQQQIGYTISTEAVSTDFVGSRQACVYDSQATIVEGNSCVLYCWYDNEFGYSCQVVRCLEKFAGVSWPSYPSVLQPV